MVTVRLDGMFFRILPGPNRLGYAKATVTVRESLAARYGVYDNGRHLPAKLIPARKLLVPKAIRPLGSLTPLVPPSAAPPAPDHPWRRYSSVTKSLNTYRT